MKDIVGKESGFFKELYKQFRNKITPEEFKLFSGLKTDCQRIAFVRERNTLQFPIRSENDAKSQKESLALKDLGNKAFQKGDNKKALELYTESILKFPENGDKRELAIIRANRSAALYHLEYYQLAIKDIDIASSLNYPKELLFKIKDRKALCLLALKQHKSGLSALRETIVALDDAKLPSEKKMKKQKDIEIMTALMLKNKLVDEPTVKSKRHSKMPDKRNQVYKAAAESVTMQYNDVMGRFAVAEQEIDVGDVILRERAHCSVLLYENSKTHCFNCFTRVKGGEPCPGCANVRFCSDQCSKVAMKTHHGVECKILKTLWESGASVTCFMALRIISQHPIQYFLSLKTDLKGDLGVWLDKEYCGMNYLTVYQLVTHENRRTSEDLLHRSFMALFLLSSLIAAGYFEGLTESDRPDAENMIGFLLLRHIQLLQFNAHEISELVGKNEKNCRSIFLGAGLYPTLALFNHSCEPSIIRYFEGTTVVVRAIKKIKPGEMIAENYGPIFTQMPKKERQLTLRNQYWFDCVCEPCERNWPLLDHMDPSILRFHCETKSCDNVVIVPVNSMNFLIQCNKCGQQVNILKGLKVLQDSESCFKVAESFSMEGSIEKAMAKFIELNKMLSEVLVPPFKDYYVCQQSLKYCFMCLGNRTEEL
ncbi:SET and MYND domain-containing protein 4-like [Cimex lectularius]|uniref:Protein-lysine N-methyltransferase SMYD4 n=1 Tax=Cimex lectularius TaxID=79782 RepID=A0A8I6RPI9_CIMLE|nr:SET and MYND domain-containing protein 4-like [Cimex lectularius]